MEYNMVERFLEFDCEDLSFNSKKSYKTDILLFLNGISEKKLITSEVELLKSITNDDVEDWSLTQRGSAYTTINRKIVALNKFFRYIYEAKKIINTNPFNGVKMKKPPKKIDRETVLNYKLKQGKTAISKEETKALIQATYIRKTKERNFELTSARNRFLLSLLFTTGLRIEEALGIEISQLKKIDGAIMVENIPSKTGVLKRVPIANECLKYYEEYLLARKKFKYGKKSDYLIIGETGGRWNNDNNSVNKKISKILEKANIGKHITCHCFRYGFKTHSTAKGINSDIIATMAGWKSELSSQANVYLINEGQLDSQMIEASNLL